MKQFLDEAVNQNHPLRALRSFLDEEEGLEKEGPTPKEGKKGGKVVKIKCPKCDKIQTVTTPKRPLEFGCDGCGMKLVLKK